MKPVILGAGSCIVHLFVDAIRELSADPGSFRFIKSYGLASEGRPPISPDILQECRLLIEEASPWYCMLSQEERALLHPECHQILVPTIHFNSLWPLMVTDPRNATESHLPYGKFPFYRGDRLALDVMSKGSSPSRQFDAYFSTPLGSVVNVGRNHELELTNMFAREANCDIKVAAYIATTFRQKRLFYTHHHPGPDLIIYALTELLADPAVRKFSEKTLSGVLDSIDEWVRPTLPDIFANDAPIHPKVAEYFGLQWYREGMQFRVDGESLSFEEWIQLYFTYEPADAVRPGMLDPEIRWIQIL